MVNIDSWFQHTAARRRLLLYASCPSNDWLVSTHSRPKAAAKVRFEITGRLKVSTHSRPKAAASTSSQSELQDTFQHTAARRRLLVARLIQAEKIEVSTHSRPKAAASIPSLATSCPNCFNTQPPEGGCG